MVALEVSPGKAYVRGYRTEFITPQYVDVEKPRDFDSIQNGIINFNLGNFMKLYDVTGWPEISGDGVTDAYQIVEFYDDWAANATATIKSGATLIGRGRLIQLQKAVTSTASTNPFGGSGPIDGVYDMWFFDPQMWTALNITNPGTFTVGMRVVGKTSGSYGYVANIGAGTHYIYLEQVTGGFTNGEILEVDGRVYGLSLIHI